MNAPTQARDDVASLEQRHRADQVELARLRDICEVQEQKIENLEVALISARTIGAAVGIVMATYHVSPDEAFDLIRQVSQRTHQRVRDIADEVMYTGTLTGDRR